jgi:DNA repair exonuclease SbcCD ATPase subunit
LDFINISKMNYKNLTELKKVLSGDIYRHVGLYTADGQKIKPFNTKIASYPDNVKDILNYLGSDIVEPGLYIIKLKKTYSGAAQEYGFNKGNVTLTEKTEIMPRQSLYNIPDDFSQAINHPAVKLQADITRLELENEDLQRQIQELNEYIGELEQKLTDQTLSEAPKEPSTFEAAKSFLTELEIERSRVNRQPGAGPQAPAVNSAQTKEKQIEQKVKAWIDAQSDNEELYNNLIVLYYNSSDLGKFAERLNEFNPELYEQCRKAVG